MKKQFLIFITFFACLLVFTACKDDGNEPNPPPEQHRKLEGQWKLVGIVDVDADTLKVLEPKDGFDPLTGYTYEYTYTLWLDTPSGWWHTANKYLRVRTLDERYKPNPNDSTMSNDEELNKIFKDFGVISYKQMYPKLSHNDFLFSYHEIHFKGDIDSFESALKSKGFFEGVERIIPTIGPMIARQAMFGFYFDGIVDYTLSTIQFKINSKPDANDVYDGDFYYQILAYNTLEFELNENELKLFYNNRKNYLLYKEVK